MKYLYGKSLIWSNGFDFKFIRKLLLLEVRKHIFTTLPIR